MYTHCLLPFKVTDEDTINDLQLRLQAESKLPVSEQELLLSTGLSPDPAKPAKQCASEMVREPGSDACVFSVSLFFTLS